MIGRILEQKQFFKIYINKFLIIKIQVILSLYEALLLEPHYWCYRYLIIRIINLKILINDINW